MIKPKMKPILFSTPMVQAILREENPKTNTRRVIKPQPVLVGMTGCRRIPILHIPGKGPLFPGDNDPKSVDVRWRFSPYKPGDILWVRETWYLETHMEAHSYVYRASSPDHPVNVGVGEHGWKPSIFMPREAARIFLHVKDVRVEQVKEISREDVIAEGFTLPCDHNYGDGIIRCSAHPCVFKETSCINKFANYWDTLNAKRGYGWDANPWVWVYEFERISRGEAEDVHR